MRIYLAAAWARKEEIKLVAADIEDSIPGVYVGSRWLNEVGTAYGGSENVSNFRTQRAKIDIDDVGEADVLVRFTDHLTTDTVPASLVTGARMVEMGYAYALGKTIIVVGGHQPIFDYLPEIIHVANVVELKNWILVQQWRKKWTS